MFTELLRALRRPFFIINSMSQNGESQQMKKMTMRKSIAIEWVNYNPRQAETSIDRNHDIRVKLNDLAVKSPICCWLILLEIFELTNQSNLLIKIARGPLEILLLLHSAQIKSLIIHEKEKNVALQKTLTFTNPKWLILN